MRKIFFLLLLITTSAYSQIIQPVKWTTSTNKISDSEYELIIAADIQENYHLYSQKVPDNGPLPTIFIFEKNTNYELIGPTTEEKGHTALDPTFQLKIKSFNTKATFKQRIKVKTKTKFNITGEIEFMTCNDSKCVTGYEDIEFKI